MPGRLADEIKQTKPFANLRQEVYLNLIRTTDEMAREVEEVLKTVHLSQTQYNVLRILRGAGDLGLPCGEIANRMLTHDPDITRLVDRLERRGLVQRSRNLTDRRVVTVQITTSGLELITSLDLDRQMRPAHDRRFAQVTDADCTQLITLLERLRLPRPQGTAP